MDEVDQPLALGAVGGGASAVLVCAAAVVQSLLTAGPFDSVSQCLVLLSNSKVVRHSVMRAPKRSFTLTDQNQSVGAGYPSPTVR